MTEWELSYIQYILFFSLFIFVESFTPKQETHHWEQVVPMYRIAGVIAKLRKLCLQNTGVVMFKHDLTMNLKEYTFM